MEQRFLVIDTDAGIDDTVALFVALRAHRDPQNPWTILAITTVAGNTTENNVGSNVATVLHTVGQSDIPIYRGAEKALVEPIPHRASHFHGIDGFGDTDLVKVEPKMNKEPAALALIRLVHKYEGKVTIAALGPLTNIALAINLDPTFSTSIKELWVMGGNIRGIGNIVSCAEFNFWADSEAAYVVLKTKYLKPINLVPWETCKIEAKFDLEFRTETLGKLNTPESNLMNKIEEKILQRNERIHLGWVPCDALVTAILVNPKISKSTESYCCSVELNGKHTRGMMVIDHRGLLAEADNVIAVTQVDMEEYAKTLIWGLGGPHFK